MQKSSLISVRRIYPNELKYNEQEENREFISECFLVDCKEVVVTRS